MRYWHRQAINVAMKNLEFWKWQASGNDFILIDNRRLRVKNSKLKELAKKYCQRKWGIGADGLLVIEPSNKAQFKMRIFNADGSEAQMCGNGARCTANWAKLKIKNSKIVKFETKAGIIQSKVSNKKNIKIKITDPFDLRLNILIKVLGRAIKINFINVGVPQAVIFVEGLNNIDVNKIGRAIRFHKKFSPQGTNVNFVEVLGDNCINIRTYERGVEAETLACGTGVVASAIITNYKFPPKASLGGRQITNYKNKLRVLTRSGEVLNVYFNRQDKKINDVWLEGKAHLVYRGMIMS